MNGSCAFLLAGALLCAACGSGGASAPSATQAAEELPVSATPEPASSLTLEPTITLTPEPQESPTPEPVYPYDTETVSITTEDGLHLSGNFFKAAGEVAVLFVHMSGPNDQKNWIPFANNVAQRGFPALTIDMRCFGASECRGGAEPGWVTTTRDLQAALDFLRAKGFKNIVCAGASMGGRSCVTVAFDEQLAGLIILSGTSSADPEKQDLKEMLNPGMPKLFIVAESDPTTNVTDEMTALYENAPEPKAFHTFPGEAHGTGFFRSPHAAAVSRLMYDFLYAIRDAAQAPAQ